MGKPKVEAKGSKVKPQVKLVFSGTADECNAVKEFDLNVALFVDGKVANGWQGKHGDVANVEPDAPCRFRVWREHSLFPAISEKLKKMGLDVPSADWKIDSSRVTWTGVVTPAFLHYGV